MTWLARITWAFAGATLAIYLLIVLWSLPLVSADAGGLTVFDLRPLGYGTDEARAFLAALGASGKAQYLGAQAMLDRVFPALLAITSVLAFWQFFRRRWAVLFGLLAVAVMVLDYQENAAVADMLKLGVEGIDEEVVSIASLLTMLKSGASMVTQVALLLGALRSLWRGRSVGG